MDPVDAGLLATHELEMRLRHMIAAVCPVESVRVGLRHDRTTWTFVAAAEATAAQKMAAQLVVDSLLDAEPADLERSRNECTLRMPPATDSPTEGPADG